MVNIIPVISSLWFWGVYVVLFYTFLFMVDRLQRFIDNEANRLYHLRGIAGKDPWRKCLLETYWKYKFRTFFIFVPFMSLFLFLLIVITMSTLGL